ncbi:MAG: hypothetical protein WAO52_04515 [Prolixibacteraceae bacterium]
MKTMVKGTLVIVLLIMTNTLFATGNLKVNILGVSSEKAVFAVSSLCNSDLKISVTDANGLKIYENESTGSTMDYLEEFNLGDLTYGKYKLKVDCGDLTTVRTFNKSGQGIKVGKEKTWIKPFFGYANGILRCTYLNFQKENMSLYFLKKDQLLYSKDLGKIFNVTEGINLSRLEGGNYEIVLSAGGKEYSFHIDKE